ncbi:hypothetical protein SCHPADRAFT_905930 [Schizopora paradoxa]|uniref:Ubiquitin-like domain-containing protein n=1 Tax=Schizopora paradoxa TaxID=27342 RepID=A0A0H2S3H5_9AGAM|nr:hypothetical protein SCHPADRAFT_905930 [Schizopora paradoxa]
MPAERTTSSTKSSEDARSSTFPLVVRYNGRSVAIPRHVNYQNAIKIIKRAFKALVAIEDSKICLFFKDIAIGDEKIEIPSETWETLVTDLRKIWIEISEDSHDLVQPLERSRIPAKKTTPKMTIHVEIPAGWRGKESNRISFSCTPSTKIAKIVEAAADHSGKDDLNWDLAYFIEGGADMDSTLEEVGIEDGFTFYPRPPQIGGKPVIYLFPPQFLAEVNVQLSLVPTWSFSALYPPTSIDEGGTQAVSWDVSATPDGTLKDKSSDLSISYLFWEAHTKSPHLLSPSPSRPSSPTIRSEFDPARACDWMTPPSSVVLPIKEVPQYLDVALKTLTLHTEARTSFITYWLPSLLKHSHVALRFLPQTAYENSAPLSVSPKPDVVTRIFMIFCGVSEDDERWNEARSRAGQEVTEVWKDAVGIDVERASDVSLFRVLEWGGMEVLYV